MNKLLKARIISNHYTKYIALYKDQTYSLEVSGRFKYVAFQKSDYPVVGDYVYFRETNELEGIIESIEERENTLSRLGASNTFNEQIIASNIDLVFICVSLNEDYHIRKVLNFLSMTSSMDFERILVFTKSDLCETPEAYIEEVKVYSDIKVMVTSSFSQEDIDALYNVIGVKTCVFIGSSGVGKSTIINKLIKREHFKTNDIRISDAQGRHTTVHKELVYLASGGAIIDSPGIRVVNSYQVDDVEYEFKDILDIAAQCKFRDCHHEKEPGCEINKQLETGELMPERFNQYVKAIRFNEHIKRQEHIKSMQQNKRNK